MSTKFNHYPLELIQPSFEDPLTDLVIELDGLRNKVLYGSTKPFMFFQIKRIFHLLESLGSARIEGNNTTIAELIESNIEESKSSRASLLEIDNIQMAMEFIDKNIEASKIDRAFISELHKMVVNGLPLPPEGEGDKTPGKFRSWSVKIKNANHQPPELESQVEEYMEELITFLNSDHPSKYDLIKTALAHHRFMWIHPFGNGNGRTGRLLTYAMLLKQGFNIKKGRLVNPTAIFCLDRQLYNEMLAIADTGKKADLTRWSEFVLQGLKVELEKFDMLLDYNYFKNNIVLPSLKVSLERKLLTETEESILRWTINNEEQLIKNGDIKKHILKGKSPQQISNLIKSLVNRKMLMPLKDSPRKYYVRFDNNYLLRAVIKVLGEKDFLPLKE